jgi:hypothetical protein
MNNKKKKINRAGLKKRKKHADLDPIYMPRVRREFVDHDYVKQLTDAEKDWLSKFDSEYYGASIKKTKKGTIRKEHLHSQDDSYAKQLYDANNKRNNDLYGVTRINGLLENIDGQNDGIGLADYTKSETAMVELINQKQEAILDWKRLLAVVAQVLYWQERKASKKLPGRVRRAI